MSKRKDLWTTKPGPKHGPKPAMRLSLLSLTFMLAVLVLALSGSDAGAFVLNVLDQDGTPVSGFKWLVEEDATHPVNIGQFDPASLSLSIHKSYAPVEAKGASATSSAIVNLPSNRRYAVSVLPHAGYSISGANVAVGQTTVTVTVQKHPIPTAQITVFVFEDNKAISGIAEIPAERPLPNFAVQLYDPLGQVTMDAFGNPLGTTYRQNANGTYQFDVDGNPLVLAAGTGLITDSTGFVYIKNIPPGAYSITASPRDGQEWIQTVAIGGTPKLFSWVKAGEPPYLPQMGILNMHVYIGFVQPFRGPQVAASLGGTGSISGTVVSIHSSRPPNAITNTAGPVEDCWVGLNTVEAGTELGVLAQPCGPGGTFSITGLPVGTYQLTMWDRPLDYLMNVRTISIPGIGVATGDPVVLGDVPITRWFGSLVGKVYFDANDDGTFDAGDTGMANQVINIRARDGSIIQSTVTDAAGDYVLSEFALPVDKWVVPEVDYTRYKALGATVTPDGGGYFDPLTAQNNPLPGYPERHTAPSPFLLEGMVLHIDQTNVIDWQKGSYGPGENGGIVGIVFYATTRAENDPRFGAGEPWEPGIPRAQVNLYHDADLNGAIDDINGNGGVDLADVDNFPFDNFPGPEDTDRNGDRQFDGGDAIEIVHTDSFDDSAPTGCNMAGQIINSPTGQSFTVQDCAETLQTWNQIRPAVFDGGYAFTSYVPGGVDTFDAGLNPRIALPAGGYVVTMDPPPGYELVKEEDKNVDFGDQYTPALMPPTCVGDMRTVPLVMTMDGVSPTALGGQVRPLCDKKQVLLSEGQQMNSDFHVFTEVPKAGRVVGKVTNLFANAFNPNDPNFGGPLSPSWVPVSIQDFSGKELVRAYTDEWGGYNAMVPTTWTINPPIPTGVSPSVVTVCANHPGPIPDPNNPGQFITDPMYNSNFGQPCMQIDVWPGRTTYMINPIFAIAAFTGATTSTTDCELPDNTPTGVSAGTPVIFSASGPLGGPHVTTTGQRVTITSRGAVNVPDPNWNGVGTPTTVTRDYGFGAPTIGNSITLNGEALTDVIWASDGMTVSGIVPAGAVTGQLMVTRGDNGKTSMVGVTLHVGGNVVRVAPGQSIQSAINAAAPNSIVLVPPGTYNENLIMWKPLSLQGWGAPSTIIQASSFGTSPAKQTAWRTLLTNLITGGSVDTVPGQRTNLALEEGAGITVMGTATNFTSSPNARIDGLTIVGATQGGGIFANGYAHFLEISNNRIEGNQGSFGGGIRLGWGGIVNATRTGYIGSQNDNVKVHHNLILSNGSTDVGGGFAALNGSDNYRVTENFICGNYAAMNGGGIGHFGLSPGGLIARNKIVFNESFGEGGGLNLIGEFSPVGSPAGTLTPGTGSVTIDSNLIQGNLAGDDGGGISLFSCSGQDVLPTPGGPVQPRSAWYRFDITNNHVVNNVAAFAGGGIGLSDTVNIHIVHNTVAQNDSTATAAVFVGGGLGSTSPQGAGLVARQNSGGLVAASGEAFTNPVLHNNIFWRNRSFYWNGQANPDGSPCAGACLGGLVLNPLIPYWDFQIFGTVVGQALAPGFSIISEPAYQGVNSNPIADATALPNYPNFVQRYDNVITSAPGAGALMNFITYGPRTVSAGNYHLSADAPTNFGNAIDGYGIPGLSTDYDGQARPNGASPNVGADEYYASPAPDTLPLSVKTAPTGRTVSKTIIGPIGIAPDGAYSISGTVKDSRGNPIPGATVTAALLGGASVRATTDAYGAYRVEGLADGRYRLSASKTGYSFVRPVRAVTIRGADATGLDFKGRR